MSRIRYLWVFVFFEFGGSGTRICFLFLLKKWGFFLKKEGGGTIPTTNQ